MDTTTKETVELSAPEQTETVTAPGIEMDPGSDASAPTGERHVPFGVVSEQSGTTSSDGMGNADSVAKGNVKVQKISLSPEDQALKEKQESLILEGKKDIGNGTIKIARAVYFFHSHKNGILWKECESFEEYARKNWGIEKSQTYRLLTLGRRINNLENSHQRDMIKLPISEIQMRATEGIPESLWCDFWINMTKERDPADLTRGDIEEEAQVYMKRKGLDPKKKQNSQTTKVGRVLSKFKDLKEDLSKLKELDLLDPRIQSLIALLGQKSEGTVDPDETSAEEFNSAVQQGAALLIAREQGGSQFDWEAVVPSAKDDAESDKPEEVTV